MVKFWDNQLKVIMSLGELLVIVIVSLLVLKPEDLPKILRKIRDWKNFIDNTKKSVIASLDITNEMDNFKEVGKEDIEQINFYLAKIAAYGEEYEGDYSLNSIKDYYRKLVNRRLAESSSGESSPRNAQGSRLHKK